MKANSVWIPCDMKCGTPRSEMHNDSREDVEERLKAFGCHKIYEPIEYIPASLVEKLKDDLAWAVYILRVNMLRQTIEPTPPVVEEFEKRFGKL